MLSLISLSIQAIVANNPSRYGMRVAIEERAISG
jgi:hypothetical protein